MKQRFLISMFAGLVMGAVAMAQQPAATGMSKQEMAVKKAQDKVAKLERKMEIADSLISAGNMVIGDLKSEEKANVDKLNEIKDGYDEESKRIGKEMKSKDKGVVQKAMADQKALDAKNKAEMKEMDAKMKASIKQADKADANIKKGKDLKKAAQGELKAARKELAAAEKAINAPADKKK